MTNSYGFPFQFGPPDGAGEMREMGCGWAEPWRSKKREQMRPIRAPVAVMRRDGFLDDGDIGRHAGARNTGKGRAWSSLTSA